MITTSENSFVEVAYRIATKICRDAIWAGAKCNWVGPSMEYLEGAWKTVQRAYSSDVYSGTCGIGYFLSVLYSRCKDPIIKHTALGCFAHAIDNADKIPEGARIGFYTGWAGLAYILRQCGTLLEVEALHKKAEIFLAAIDQFQLPESGIDILAGSAGAIPVLLGRTEKSDSCIATAKKIADHLIAIAHKEKSGWSWNTLQPGSSDPTGNLTGFSHGTAGIAWAFIELYAKTGDIRYFDAAQQAFTYERYLFNPEYGNWPDLRNKNSSDIKGGLETIYGTYAWCHGAPGIGLSRLRVYDLVKDEACKQEALTAINSTYSNVKQTLENTQGNFSLCHGIAGNSELLLMAAVSFDRPELFRFVHQVGQAGIDQYLSRDTPWPCGIMGAGEAPGLMLGLAGIGYFYLRLADPWNVPSILLPSVTS